MENKTLGQVAYEAYCAKTGWKSLVSGADLPQWAELKSEIRDAWGDAAEAVAGELESRATQAQEAA